MNPFAYLRPILLGLAITGADASAEHLLVEGGNAHAVICLSQNPAAHETEAARLLQSYLLKATGVELPIATSTGSAPEGGDERMRIYIGDHPTAAEHGLLSSALLPEEYIVRSHGRDLFILGRDTRYGAPETASDSVTRSAATKWAVNHLADQHLGVRWLWPGEAGTYIPQAKRVAIPAQDQRLRPKLELRRLRINLYRRTIDGHAPLLGEDERQPLRRNALDWLENHQMGSRANFQFRHAFTQWWERYSETAPDLFALPPSSRFQQPFPQPKAVKLRLANPAVIDTIEKEYLAAGAPDTWNIAPNDGIGFDTSRETAAWDGPTPHDPNLVWTGKANLTRRYITFWNKVYERLSRINPAVRLSTLVYSSYRNPASPDDVPVKARLIAAFVHSYTARDNWRYWSDQGCEMILRPNWWVVGGSAPHLPIRQEGGFVAFAREHGMIGFDMDSLVGYWGLQAPRYYVVARLIARPDLSPEQALEEFAAAFGKGAPAIRDYLAYWQDYSEKAAYPVSAGGTFSVDPNGLFETAARKIGFQHMPVVNSSVMIPALYPDTVLAPAFAFLDAAQKAAHDEPEALARIDFLRSGLVETEKIRQVLTLANDLRTQEKSTLRERYNSARGELREQRKMHTQQQVLWGDDLYYHEYRRKVPTFPEFIHHRALDIREEGM